MKQIRTYIFCLTVCFCTTLLSFVGGDRAIAQERQVGSSTHLPIPRFVTLKSDRVNMREGPSRDNQVSWVYQKAGLPVEIVAEFDVWRKIRDNDGVEGWTLHSLLSGKRNALVAPWVKDQNIALRERGDKNSAVVAELQPYVLAKIKSCNGKWCLIQGKNFKGYIAQNEIWGAYPNEVIKD